MEEVSSSPPSPWPSPTKPPEVRKPRPFQPPLLRRMENLVEQMKGRVSEEEGEAPKRGKKSSLKENEKAMEQSTSKHKKKATLMNHKKASRVLSLEEEMASFSQPRGDVSLKPTEARPKRPSTGSWYSEKEVASNLSKL